ncbi:MAG: hypothetical protein SOV55_01570 [Candidatus Borkfalkiaceae bacterium]|nr:hypothetical protein [bacterium]MDY2850794.1 hypothetical protein [Christensenellaceae bacterium]
MKQNDKRISQKKAEQLVEKMTVYEMISQLLYVFDGIERLNVCTNTTGGMKLCTALQGRV